MFIIFVYLALEACAPPKRRSLYHTSIQQRPKLDDGFVSCCRDKTATRVAAIELQAAKEQIIDIWESMTDAYVTIDRDWRMIYANQAATQIISQLTNLTPEVFLGSSHWDLFPSLVNARRERVSTGIDRTGGSPSGGVVRADGELV